MAAPVYNRSSEGVVALLHPRSDTPNYAWYKFVTDNIVAASTYLPPIVQSATSFRAGVRATQRVWDLRIEPTWLNPNLYDLGTRHAAMAEQGRAFRMPPVRWWTSDPPEPSAMLPGPVCDPVLWPSMQHAVVSGRQGLELRLIDVRTLPNDVGWIVQPPTAGGRRAYLQVGLKPFGYY